jgi:hypothetical protein
MLRQRGVRPDRRGHPEAETPDGTEKTEETFAPVRLGPGGAPAVAARIP